MKTEGGQDERGDGDTEAWPSLQTPSTCSSGRANIMFAAEGGRLSG